MKTLVISDIHQRCTLVDRILKQHENNVDHIVFLGDYFDTFHVNPDTSLGLEKTCEWLCNTFDRLGDKATWLLGNHDLPYYEFCYSRKNYVNYSCPGWSLNRGHDTRKYFGSINSKYTLSLSHPFFTHTKLYTKIGPYYLSHAGFNERLFFPKWDLYDNIKYYDTLTTRLHEHIWQDPIDELLYIGRSRGGEELYGGILWQDWDFEFVPIEELPQIVGHTIHKEPQQKFNSYNLDTNNNYVAIIDEYDILIFDKQGNRY